MQWHVNNVNWVHRTAQHVQARRGVGAHHKRAEARQVTLDPHQKSLRQEEDVPKQQSQKPDNARIETYDRSNTQK